MKPKIVILSLIALLISLYILPVFAVSYTVPNGDFESWTSGDPDDWTSDWDLTEETTTPSFVHSGTSAVKLTTTSNWTILKASALIPVNPSAFYDAKVWVIDNDPDGDLGMNARYYNSDNITLGASGFTAYSNNADYVLLANGFTTPSNCVFLELTIEVDNSVTGTFTVYVDDYTLVGPALPEFNAPLIIILSGLLIISSVFLYKKNQ